MVCGELVAKFGEFLGMAIWTVKIPRSFASWVRLPHSLGSTDSSAFGVSVSSIPDLRMLVAVDLWERILGGIVSEQLPSVWWGSLYREGRIKKMSI